MLLEPAGAERDAEMTTLTVEAAEAGERLDKMLAGRLEDVSRAAIQHWIAEGRVTVDGAPARASLRLAAGQTIALRRPAEERVELQAEPIALAILYEDDDLLVINKPAGMVVHPAPGRRSGTLVNALLARYPQWAAAELFDDELAGEEDDERLGVVHRLDKDTSGVLLVAKSAPARDALQAQFQARQVQKTYLALVHGVPESPSGIIEAPIGRDPRQRKRMAVVRGGRPARTSYQVVESFAEYALLEAHPVTGRTHQIRVHLAYIGHPVVGDAVYGRRKRAIPCPRQFLHAWRIELTHPSRQTPLVFSAPLPDDLSAVLETLRPRMAAGES